MFMRNLQPNDVRCGANWPSDGKRQELGNDNRKHSLKSVGRLSIVLSLGVMAGAGLRLMAAGHTGRGPDFLASGVMPPTFRVALTFSLILLVSAAFAAGLATVALAQSTEGDPLPEGETERFCPTPAAPTGLNAMGGNRTISVSWNSVNNPYPDFYLDYTVVASGPGGSTKTTSSTSTSFSGLTNGHTYTISVRANLSDDIGFEECSGPSASTTATPVAPPTPTPVAPPSGKIGIDKARINVGETLKAIAYDVHPNDLAIKFRISGPISIEGNCAQNVDDRDHNLVHTSVILEGCSPGTAGVSLLTSTDVELDSLTFMVLAVPTVPGKVSKPNLLEGDQNLAANWSAPGNGGSAITRYEVQHKLTTATWPIGAGANNGTSLRRTITGLTNGNSYDVRVRACNSVGCGLWSDPETGIPTAVANVPNQVPKPGPRFGQPIPDG